MMVSMMVVHTFGDTLMTHGQILGSDKTVSPETYHEPYSCLIHCKSDNFF